MTNSPNRRDSLRTAAIAGSAVALPAQTPALATEGWFDRPMRWAQLTLVEDDPSKYDLAFWLDYFKRTHSDAACLSAGGCVAYYPTKIPLHYRSGVIFDNVTDPSGAAVVKAAVAAVLEITRPFAISSIQSQPWPCPG
jgi:hypothetical protein